MLWHCHLKKRHLKVRLCMEFNLATHAHQKEAVAGWRLPENPPVTRSCWPPTWSQRPSSRRPWEKTASPRFDASTWEVSYTSLKKKQKQTLLAAFPASPGNCPTMTFLGSLLFFVHMPLLRSIEEGLVAEILPLNSDVWKGRSCWKLVGWQPLGRCSKFASETGRSGSNCWWKKSQTTTWHV